jgi:hypothetical protein
VFDWCRGNPRNELRQEQQKVNFFFGGKQIEGEGRRHASCCLWFRAQGRYLS